MLSAGLVIAASYLPLDCWTGDRCFMLSAGLVIAASCFPLDWLSLLHTYS
ncbi:hypothetical protein RRG08_045204 [Elysia crispata]|uniref:Uncharacterized protein n=1 Tax=Elysia crispata TaxID=231223 RepID=A0AAE1DRY4_9GAST|nr:hypothetical protein RRG08_045204 [Elysia crispata]